MSYSKDEHIKSENFKTILCKNITSYGKCAYCDKCLYAHTLEEQNVEPIRKQAYKLIKNTENLSNIDLTKDQQLYENLLTLTKLCQYCEEKTCTGGYNCKHGACDKMYVICHMDLTKGTCDNKCGKKHLSKKGLIPYCVKVVKNLKTAVNIPSATIINDDFFKRLEENITNVKSTNDLEWDDIDDTNDMNKIVCNKDDEDIFIEDQNDYDEYEFDLQFNNLKSIANSVDKLKQSIFKIDIMCL